jgi:hypothetical protein
MLRPADFVYSLPCFWILGCRVGLHVAYTGVLYLLLSFLACDWRLWMHGCFCILQLVPWFLEFDVTYSRYVVRNERIS